METAGPTNGGAALGTMGPPPATVLTRTTHVSPRVEGLGVTAYEIPTERPESDGTLEWDSTTLILVEAFNGRERGIGYTYADRSVATLIESKLTELVSGADAMRPPRSGRRCGASFATPASPGSARWRSPPSTSRSGT